MPETTPRDPDSLPWSEDPSGVCPNCNRTANFDVVTEANSYQDNRQHNVGPSHFAVILRCQGCRRGLVVVEALPPHHLGYALDQAMKYPDRHPILWWPTPGAGTLDQSVPDHIADVFDESTRCLSVQAAGAAVERMRLMLAMIVRDQAPDLKLKGTLAAQLQKLSDEGLLHPSLAAWAQEIRELGNASAHADDPTKIPPNLNDAVTLHKLCRRLVENLYEIPARIGRDRAALPPTTPQVPKPRNLRFKADSFKAKGSPPAS